MIACPHRLPVRGTVVRCDLLASRGVSAIAGPGSKNDICARCTAEWKSGPPSIETLPPVLQMLIDEARPVIGNDRDPATSYPTLADMVTNFAGAMGRIIKAAWHGREVLVDEERFHQVLACCDACQKWDGTARHGLGKCSHPGCGCTVAKIHLATEKCPAGGWDNADPSLPIVCPFPKDPNPNSQEAP